MAQETKKTEQRVILNNGAMQHLLTIPDKGLLVRLRVNGIRLAASFEEGGGQPGASLQMITWALEKLQVDPILDPNDPFEAYHPGVMRR